MEIQTLIFIIAACFGLINLCRFLLRILVSIWTTFIRPGKNLKSYGSWAAITGSTDGIGKALAFEMAARGLNLVLVGRNPSKLETTSREIREKHGGVSVKTVVIDFSGCCGAEIARIFEEEIRGLDLGILVNNVGTAYPHPKFFHEVDVDLMESIVGVNVAAATWVTKAAVAVMRERKRGAVVNVGSGASACVSSYPLFSVYTATKAYVAMLSKSMSLEYKQYGIDVQCQMPLLVATRMTFLKKSSFFIPSPEKYSKASIRWIGHDSICIPYWPHALQALFLSFIPHQLLDNILLRYFIRMRERARRKASQLGQVVEKGSFKIGSTKLN